MSSEAEKFRIADATVTSESRVWGHNILTLWSTLTPASSKTHRISPRAENRNKIFRSSGRSGSKKNVAFKTSLLNYFKRIIITSFLTFPISKEALYLSQGQTTKWDLITWVSAVQCLRTPLLKKLINFTMEPSRQSPIKNMDNKKIRIFAVLGSILNSLWILDLVWTDR